jgi:hypothetical protein
MTFNVLRRWFALLHLLRNASQDHVVPDVDGPEIVDKTDDDDVPPHRVSDSESESESEQDSDYFFV